RRPVHRPGAGPRLRDRQRLLRGAERLPRTAAVPHPGVADPAAVAASGGHRPAVPERLPPRGRRPAGPRGLRLHRRPVLAHRAGERPVSGPISPGPLTSAAIPCAVSAHPARVRHAASVLPGLSLTFTPTPTRGGRVAAVAWAEPRRPRPRREAP